MVTLKRALIALVIPIGFLVFPTLSLAASYPAPFTDDFSTYPSGWYVGSSLVGGAGRSGFQTFSGSECKTGDCIGATFSGSTFTGVAAKNNGSAAGIGATQGGFLIWMKTNGGGNLHVDLCGNGSSGGDTAYCRTTTYNGTTQPYINFQDVIAGGDLITDGNYHFYTILWDSNGTAGAMRYCKLIDSVDDTLCSWTAAAYGQTYINGISFRTDSWNSGGNYLYIDDISEPGSGPLPDHTTHIVSFTPEEGTTTGNDVTFALHIYVNADDLSTLLGVQLDYHNFDQNNLLSDIPFVSHDAVLFAGQATTSGDFYFTATSTLPDGNYRVQASIKRTLIGTFINPFSHINDTQNHQFIVNQGTYIGNLNQNGFREFNSIFASSSATSTAAASLNCNPLTFSINLCLAFLFIPGGPQLDNSIQAFQDGVATRWPWGYFYRVYAIFTNPATNTLPSFTTDIVIGPPSNLATTSLSYDPGDMIAGAGALLDTVHDNQHGKSFREVMEPFVLLMVALMVVFTIFSDITGSHKHHQEQTGRQLS